MKKASATLKLQYDQVVINIEFLLISVIQGVAFSSLISNAMPLITSGDIEYWPYIISGLLFILIYWSHSIIHAISFIDWPLDLTHSFLYFITSFFEVIAISEMTKPLHWYISVLLLFLVGEVLYILDLELIRSREKQFMDSPERKNLYHHILSRHIYELRIIMPVGIVLNLVACALIYIFPQPFIGHKYHLVLTGIQIVFSGVMLGNAVNSFSKRTKLITEVIENSKENG